MEQLNIESAKANIKELERLLAIRPTSDIVGNLAACYFTINESEKALPLAIAAYQANPKSKEACVNVSMILKDLGRHEESARFIELAYYDHPDDFFVRLGYAEALLKAGLWTQAWPIYDNARPTQQAAASHIGVPIHVKEWQDQIIKPGERLLVINEGGTGDRFTYPRWLPELTKRGIDWIFYPYEELFPFYERIFPRERLVKDNEKFEAEYWTTSFALPARLNATPTSIPEPLKFIPDPEALKRCHLNKPPGVKVFGICWQAAELFQGGKRVRSMSEGQMMRLITSTAYKVSWVNLQYGIGTKAPYPVSNIPINNWEDTAAIISQLDGVVTVDTGVMHLAGALRVPIYILLSGNSCWKFLKTGTKCYWFPTAKLYRNRGYGFDNAIDNLVLDIRNGVI